LLRVCGSLLEHVADMPMLCWGWIRVSFHAVRLDPFQPYKSALVKGMAVGCRNGEVERKRKKKAALFKKKGQRSS
jgi:hypothetical protein